MSERISIVVAEGTFADLRVEEETLGDRAEIRLASLRTPADVAAATADAHAVVVTNNPLNGEHIAALGPQVRLIARAGIGLDAIDCEAAARRTLAVYHVPDYATNEVATHAAAMMLAVHRRLREADDIARTRWPRWAELKPIHAIESATVGIVGLGRIGLAVAHRLRPFAARLIGFDPLVQDPVDAVSVVESLRAVLEASDLVSVHVPLTATTRGMISGEQLGWMRKGAILVNVSRGGLVDEEAVAAALESGRLGGAAFDVSEHEPPSPDSPLLRAPRLLLSPHTAWYSETAEIRLRRTVVEAIVSYLSTRTIERGRLAVDPA